MRAPATTSDVPFDLPDLVPGAASAAADDAGFTLIELIVVFVILGILFGIATISYNSARQLPNRQAAIGAARNIADAAEQFRNDHGGRPPDASRAADWGPYGPIDPDGRPYVNPGRFAAVDDGRVGLCRTNNNSTSNVAKDGARFGTWNTTQCSPAGTGDRARIVYHLLANGFWIDVFMRPDENVAFAKKHYVCSVTGGSVPYQVVDRCD